MIYCVKVSAHRSEIQLYCLPMEILDIILRNSYLHWILNSPTKKRDEEVIRSLISVDVCFNRRITSQRFKKAIWRYLGGLNDNVFFQVVLSNLIIFIANL